MDFPEVIANLSSSGFARASKDDKGRLNVVGRSSTIPLLSADEVNLAADDEVLNRRQVVWPGKLLKKYLPLVPLVPNFASSLSGTPKDIGALGFPVRYRRPSTYYPKGAVVTTYWGKMIQCVEAGITAAGSGADSASARYQDGTSYWRYLQRSDPLICKTGEALSYGDYRRTTSSGRLLKCVVAGTTSGSLPDAAQGVTTTFGNAQLIGIGEVWIDSVGGSDTADGYTFSTAKKTLPAVLASNTHYWIVAGSEFVYDVSAVNAAVTVNATHVSMSVVSRDTGNEVVSQQNPFILALQGKSIGPSDRATKYFSIIGNGPALKTSAISGTNGKGIAGTAGNTSFKLRGAWIIGMPYGGIVANAGGFWDVSDIVLENCAAIQDSSRTAGCGIRFEGATVNGGHSIRRWWATGTGEDAFWGSSAAVNWTISDFAIYHAPRTTQVDSHTDAIQFGSYPGASSIRRGIIEHDLRNVTVEPAVSVGAALISDGSGAAGANTLVVEDVIAISTRTVTNWQLASSFSRCLFGLSGAGDGNASIHVQNADWALTDSVNVLDTSGGRSDQYYWYKTPSKTNVKELML